MTDTATHTPNRLRGLTTRDIINGGIGLLLISGLGYLVAYDYQRGILEGFGITGLPAAVTSSTYVAMLQSTGSLVVGLLFLISFKDDLVKHLSKDKAERKKHPIIRVTVASLVVLVLFFFLTYSINSFKLVQSLKDTWNNYVAYIVTLGIFGFFVVAISRQVSSLIDNARSDLAKTSTGVKLFHYVTEFLYIVISVFIAVSLLGLLTDQLGQQSVRQDGSYLLAEANGKRYLVVQDEGSRLVGAVLCANHSYQLKKGYFAYLDKNRVSELHSISYAVNSHSFCK